MEISLTWNTVSLGLKVAGVGIYSIMYIIYGDNKFSRIHGVAVGLAGAGWIISGL